jgi:hypothetical protein
VYEEGQSALRYIRVCILSKRVGAVASVEVGLNRLFEGAADAVEGSIMCVRRGHAAAGGLVGSVYKIATAGYAHTGAASKTARCAVL